MQSSVHRSRIRMNKDDRQKGIIDEAIRIIGEKGFNGFSIKELADRCAMTDAGLLHHFGTKTNLLLALLDERDRQDEAAIAIQPESAEAHRPQTRESIRRILSALVGRNAGHPELIRLYAMLRIEALSPDHPAHTYFARRDKAARSRFGDLFSPISDEPQALARRVLAALDGLELQWLCEDRAFDLAGEWEKIAEQLFA